MLLKRWSTVGVVVALGVVPVLGTVIVERTFDEACARAEAVFCGRAVSVESRRDADGGGIHTFVTFDQLDWIEGDDSAQTYTLRLLGGAVGGESLVVQGMPRFVVGRRYVLFVRGNNRAPCPLVGWHQGCFGVAESANGAAPGVVRYDGRPVLSISQGKVISEGSPQAGLRFATPMTLARFSALIRERRSMGSEGP